MQLIYVESPLQLVNAIHIISHYEEEAVLYYRDNGTLEQQKQFQFIFQYNKRLLIETTIKKLKIHRDVSFFRNVKFIFCIFIMLLKSLKCKCIIVGDLRTPFYKLVKGTLRIFKYKKIIVVDDGLYLYPFLKQGKNNYDSVVFATNLPIDSLGTFEILKNIERRKDNGKAVRNNDFVFIGSKLVEFDLCKIEDYLKALVDILKICHEKGASKVYYVPHREENASNLRVYESLGFVIKEVKEPLEIHENINGKLGGNYFSFYSTALFNLASLDRKDFAKYYSIKPTGLFWLKNKENINDVYTMFEKLNCIQIIEIEVCSNEKGL